MLEVADAAASVYGPGRIGMHLAPRADSHSMGDSDLAATFGYAAAELGKRGIAFLCAREYDGPDSLAADLRKAFGGVYIANEKFTAQTAQAALDAGKADAVAFGKAYIANPDLVERLRLGAPLNDPDPTTFYGGDGRGYVDYPTLKTPVAAAAE